MLPLGSVAGRTHDIQERETVSNHVIGAAFILFCRDSPRPSARTEMATRDHITLEGNIIISLDVGAKTNVICPLGAFENRKQTYKQTNKQTDRQTDRQTFSKTRFL